MIKNATFLLRTISSPLSGASAYLFRPLGVSRPKQLKTTPAFGKNTARINIQNTSAECDSANNREKHPMALSKIPKYRSRSRVKYRKSFAENGAVLPANMEM